jgi:hypothetical protein
LLKLAKYAKLFWSYTVQFSSEGTNVTYSIKILADSTSLAIAAPRLTTFQVNFNANEARTTPVRTEIRGLSGQTARNLMSTWEGHSVVVTAQESEWIHFLGRQRRKQTPTEDEITLITRRMAALLASNRTALLRIGQWHLPFVNFAPGTPDTVIRMRFQAAEFWCKVSAVRCALASHLPNTDKPDALGDSELFDALIWGGNQTADQTIDLRPLEHVACATNAGWRRFSQDIPSYS